MDWKTGQKLSSTAFSACSRSFDLLGDAEILRNINLCALKGQATGLRTGLHHKLERHGSRLRQRLNNLAFNCDGRWHLCLPEFCIELPAFPVCRFYALKMLNALSNSSLPFGPTYLRYCFPAPPWESAENPTDIVGRAEFGARTIHFRDTYRRILRPGIFAGGQKTLAARWN